MKNLIPALMVLALTATAAHAQSAERHCIECGSVAASPADMRLGGSGAGASAIAAADYHGSPSYLYGSGWNSTASGSEMDAHTVPPTKPDSVAKGADDSNAPVVFGSGAGGIANR